MNPELKQEDAIFTAETQRTRRQDPSPPLTADLCIKCNICTAHCPVARVTDLFPGPKFVGPQAQRMRNPHEASVDDSLDYCSGCGICTMVCPHGVKVMEMNARARHRLYRRRPIPLRNRLLGRSEWLGRLGSPVAPFANALLAFRPARLLLETLLGIHRDAPMPPFAFAPFRGWFRGVHQKSGRAKRSEKKVVYFHGCSANYYEPHLGKTVVAVLEHNGFEVIVPPQVCCGLPLLSNAEFDAARAYARRNLQSLARYAREGYAIVGASSSCTLTLKSDYRHILGIHTEAAELVARHTYDLCEFLLELAEKGELRTDFRPIERAIPYHAPCQLKAHGMGLPAIDLLERIPGLRVDLLDADCCGIAGTYGFKKEKYGIAMAVGRPLFEQIQAAGSPIVLCDSETCRWQIAHATGAKLLHPVQVLAAAYGLDT